VPLWFIKHQLMIIKHQYIFHRNRSLLYPVKIFYLLLLVLFAPTLFCYPQSTGNSQGYRFPYSLSKPDEKYILPPVLEEISGIVLLNGHIMACIQDEEGDLFFYGLKEKRILKRVGFGKDADYEDLALAGDNVYVLRSNGTIYELENYDNEEDIVVNEYKTRLSKKNNCEGLCYDPKKNSLLIALKGEPEAGEEQDFDGFKAIYTFDIAKKKVKKKPAYLIDLEQIKEAKKQSGNFRFQPSAIAIHPITDEIYVLASVGKAIIVMNRAGELLHYAKLNKWLFVQPEGISFAPDGTLYISNEGDGGNGTIMEFGMVE